jgi:hypothetical protein
MEYETKIRGGENQMWRRRKSHGVGPELDAALRSQRVEPREEFVEGLSRRVLAEPLTVRRAWSGMAFAAAVSTLILGMFASFGGLSYAASGADGAYHAAKQVAVKHTLKVSVHKSSAAAQYAPTPKPHKKHKKSHPVAGVKASTGVAGASAGVSTGKTLPFTGLSLLTTLILSLALIVVGVALRRREREN